MGAIGANESVQINDILCPKCPLTPIISISLNSKGILICEYRCPFMHFDKIPYEDILKDKEKNYGKFCEKCVNLEEDPTNNENKDDLLYCGICKQFICINCGSKHDKEKESHQVLIPKLYIKYTCLEHGKKYIGFCFTCIISICEDCKRHNNHCTKLFREFYPDYDFIQNYNFYLEEYDDYINIIKKSKYYNNHYFTILHKMSKINEFGKIFKI